METKNALILYGIGTLFAIGGYFNQYILGMGWAFFGVLVIVGLLFRVDQQ